MMASTNPIVLQTIRGQADAAAQASLTRLFGYLNSLVKREHSNNVLILYCKIKTLATVCLNYT